MSLQLIKFNLINSQVKLMKDKFNCLIDLTEVKPCTILIQYELLSKYPDWDGVNFYLKQFKDEYEKNNVSGIVWSKTNNICREDVWDWLDEQRDDLLGKNNV
jgi:hypothetical protein